ncbi:MAG: ABC transporter ATP-binding protein [Burkholderiales bacterium]
MDIIRVEKATKAYKEHIVLDDVSLSFAEKQIHGIVGRNGSGKTILFKSICGFVPLTSGRITVNNLQIGKDVDVPRDVGIIIEAPGFLPNYSAFDNLKLLAAIKRKISSDRIREVLQLVGLNPDNKKHVGKFSLGMRQRLGIAQAIMEDPSLLILDEPFNGLDISGVEDIRKVFLHLKEKGKTILMASHSKEDIDLLCDTVHRMDNGKIV